MDQFHLPLTFEEQAILLLFYRLLPYLRDTCDDREQVLQVLREVVINTSDVNDQERN